MYVNLRREGILCAWRVQVGESSGVISVDANHTVRCDGVPCVMPVGIRVKQRKFCQMIYSPLRCQVGCTMVPFSLVIKTNMENVLPLSATLVKALTPTSTPTIPQAQPVIITSVGNALRRSISALNPKCSPWQPTNVVGPQVEHEVSTTITRQALTALYPNVGVSESIKSREHQHYFTVFVIVAVLVLPMLFDLPYRPYMWSITACSYLAGGLAWVLLSMIMNIFCSCGYAQHQLKNCIYKCRCRGGERDGGQYANLAVAHDGETEYLFRQPKCSEVFISLWFIIALAAGGLLILAYSTRIHLTQLSLTPLNAPVSSAIDPRYNVYRFAPDVQVRPDLYTLLRPEVSYLGFNNVQRVVVPLVQSSDNVAACNLSQFAINGGPERLVAWLTRDYRTHTPDATAVDAFPQFPVVGLRYNEWHFSASDSEEKVEAGIVEIFANHGWKMPPSPGLRFIETFDIDGPNGLNAWKPRIFSICIALIVIYCVLHILCVFLKYLEMKHYFVARAMVSLFQEEMMRVVPSLAQRQPPLHSLNVLSQDSIELSVLPPEPSSVATV